MGGSVRSIPEERKTGTLEVRKSGKFVPKKSRDVKNSQKKEGNPGMCPYLAFDRQISRDGPTGLSREKRGEETHPHPEKKSSNQSVASEKG